jgi:hypothetical protein
VGNVIAQLICTSLALTAGSVTVVRLIPSMRDVDVRWLAVLPVFIGGTAVLTHSRREDRASWHAA